MALKDVLDIPSILMREGAMDKMRCQLTKNPLIRRKREQFSSDTICL